MSASAITAAARGRGGALYSMAHAVLRNPIGAVALVALVLVVALSTLAPWIAPNDPNHVRVDMVNAPIGGDYLLGGDGSGRDVFSRLLVAGRFTLIGALIAVTVAVVIGVVSGLIAGYFGRFFDSLANWAAEALMALPAMIVLLALFRTLGSSMYLAMVAFGVMLSPGFFRLVRGLVNEVKHELYIDAARVSGLSDARIIRRHIMLAVRDPVIIQISIVAGIAIVLQSGLEFLGLGDSSVPSWGGMLQGAFSAIYISPLSVLWPGAMIAIVVASLVLLGNAVRDGLQRVDAATRRAAAPPASQAVHETKPDAKHSAVTDDVILSVRGLRVQYDVGLHATDVVRAVDLEVRRGEVLGLVGESGSGKSQTAFAILGLLGPGGRVTGGSVVFDGQELTDLPPAGLRKLRGGRISYIPQEPMSNLDPSFRVGSQLVEPLMAILGMTAKQAKTRALDLLARVGIPDPERTFRAFPHEISGGMAQRVLIACAISCEPDVLIADEVTTALDVTIQAEVLNLLRDLQEERGMAIVLVTHDLAVVAELCDRVAVMLGGQIVETNDVFGLFAAPKHPYTRMLLDSRLMGLHSAISESAARGDQQHRRSNA